MFHSKNHGRNLRFHQFYSLQQLKHSVLGLLFFDIQLLQETPDALPHCITFVLARPGWSCLRCHKVMAEGAGVTPLAARGREKQTPHVTWRSRGDHVDQRTQTKKGWKRLCRAALSESCSLCVYIFVIEKSANIRGFKQIKLAERDQMSIIESSSIIKYHQVSSRKGKVANVYSWAAWLIARQSWVFSHWRESHWWHRWHQWHRFSRSNWTRCRSIWTARSLCHCLKRKGRLEWSSYSSSLPNQNGSSNDNRCL